MAVLALPAAAESYSFSQLGSEALKGGASIRPITNFSCRCSYRLPWRGSFGFKMQLPLRLMEL